MFAKRKKHSEDCLEQSFHWYQLAQEAYRADRWGDGDACEMRAGYFALKASCWFCWIWS